MKQVNVCIHIIPDNVKPMMLLSYDPGSDGNVYSTHDKININIAKDGYSVIMLASEFDAIDNPKLIATVINLFAKNLPSTIINVTVQYDYEEMMDTHFDQHIGSKVLDLCQLMQAVNNTGRVPTFRYEASDSITDMVDLDMDDPDEDDEDDDMDFPFDSKSETPKDILDNPWAAFIGTGDWDDDDEDDDGKKSKNHKEKEYYGRSRVVKNSKSPKRDFHRHGVIVGSKSDIAQDKKILKRFLKDFIPGGASWKKDFRHDVLKRWMSMYSISKSDLKDIEKKQRKKVAKQKQNKYVTGAINMTSKLFTTSLKNNDWYNPNK